MPDRRGAPTRGSRDARAGRPAREKRGILETLVMSSGVRRPATPLARKRLVDLCAEWLGLVEALRGAALPDPAGLRARALDLKARLEQSTREGGFTAADTEMAVFALVAFLDETVLNAEGAAREAWLSRPLQLELYGQNIAGEEFYDRLERLRREREGRIEALEVYYTCLALGFAGKYRLSGPERLQQLLAEVERDIAAVRRSSQQPLSPHGARQEELADSVAGGVPLWLSVVIFVPAVVLMWLVVGLISRAGAGHTANAIRSLLAH
jgi:type VI secretion system protein ImpK